MALKCLECGNTEFKEQRVRYSPEIKGEKVEVKAMAFVCTKCEASVMTTEQMTVLQRLSADEYRKKHNLLTTRQIIDCRKRLGMNQVQFADYLGVGSASVARWETFAIQEKAQDELIRLKCDLSYARQNSQIVNSNTSSPDILNGNKAYNPQKLRALFFELVDLAKSALYINKAAFYADMLHFKLFQTSITGSRYLPMKHGPCPEYYDFIFKDALSEGKLKKVGEHNLKLTGKNNLSIFSADEKMTISLVKKAIQKKGIRYLFNKSHDEKGYKKADDYVSYEFARDILINFTNL